MAATHPRTHHIGESGWSNHRATGEWVRELESVSWRVSECAMRVVISLRTALPAETTRPEIQWRLPSCAYLRSFEHVGPSLADELHPQPLEVPLGIGWEPRAGPGGDPSRRPEQGRHVEQMCERHFIQFSFKNPFDTRNPVP